MTKTRLNSALLVLIAVLVVAVINDTPIVQGLVINLTRGWTLPSDWQISPNYINTNSPHKSVASGSLQPAHKVVRQLPELFRAHR